MGEEKKRRRARKRKKRKKKEEEKKIKVCLSWNQVYFGFLRFGMEISCSFGLRFCGKIT